REGDEVPVVGDALGRPQETRRARAELGGPPLELLLQPLRIGDVAFDDLDEHGPPPRSPLDRTLYVVNLPRYASEGLRQAPDPCPAGRRAGTRATARRGVVQLLRRAVPPAVALADACSSPPPHGRGVVRSCHPPVRAYRRR